MVVLRKFLRSGSPGLSKLTIIIAVVVLVGVIAALAKVGPIYKQKWDFESSLEDVLGRLSALGEEGIFDEIARYTQPRNIPIDPHTQCAIVGKPGTKGQITCNYDVPIKIPLRDEPYIMHIRVIGKRTQIPSYSN